MRHTRLLCDNASFYLVDVELFYEVEVSALPAQVSLGHGFDALLLQTVHHVVE